jgi:hypothetical protein
VIAVQAPLVREFAAYLVDALLGRHIELAGEFVVIPSPSTLAQEIEDALGR